MMREEAIVISKDINSSGQYVYFQLSLPKDTGRIIGLEYGTITGEMITDRVGFSIEAVPGPFEVVANAVKGRLTLQVPGCENLFFQGDIVEDKNRHMGEVAAQLQWLPAAWSHGRKREEITFSVDKKSNLIEGIYKDVSAEVAGFSPYKFHLYLWIEKCKP